MQKFSSGKTSVAHYSEPVTELPTIVTLIDLPKQQRQKLRNGRDYHIALASVESHWRYIGDLTNLTMGENVLESGLKVDLELLTDLEYKITPLNFSPGMPVSL